MLGAPMSDLVQTAPRRAFWWRVVLAGPLVFLCSVALMGGSAVLIPPGPAQINNVALPLVLFPGAWGMLFFYACLDAQLVRAYAVVTALTMSSGGLIAWHFVQTAQAAG